jgi:prepilin-type N-terminal cleavage/methylation domain-containing protein
MRNARGFSLMEMMIVLVIVLSITAAIFQTINMTTQRTATEQTKLDMFQEAREFMDQMTRDLRQAGYPSPRLMDASLLTSPVINDLHAAAGVVKVDTGDLIFEGDVDGSGMVSSVHYYLDTSTTNGCPCLRRSSVYKVTADPVTGQTPSYQVEVQGVQNTTIFTAFSGTTAIAPGLTVTSAAASMASIDTIQASLSLQASTIDPQTGKYPTTTLVTTVRLNNCSQAAAGYRNSCN